MHATNVSRRGFLAGAGTVLASLAMPLASSPTSAFGEEASLIATADSADKIVIIGTNDVHATLQNPVTELGYAALADYAASQRETYGADHVTLVDAGDIVQGNPVASLTEGELAARAAASCSYDVMAPGNHEFDYGLEKLSALAATEGAAYTCCNFTDATGAHVFEQYHVIEYPAGDETVRVAYVGVTTPSARGNSATFKNETGEFIYDFAIDDTGEKLYSAVQAAVDAARDAGGADYVILLAHLGQSWSAKNWRSDTVIANTTGIDAVFDAHTHQLYVQSAANRDGQEIPIVQAGSKFLAFSRLEIDLSARTATASVVATGVSAELIDTWDGADEEVAALMADIDAQIDAMAGEEIGNSEVDLIALADDGSQAAWLGETNLGDLIADAILDATDNAGVACDLALYDGFGICADIPTGTVTQRDLLDALACNRQILALEVSGQHLLNVLEVACALLPEPEARLLQVSDGFSYTIDTNIESPLVVSDATIGFVDIEGERRVVAATLNGEEIDERGSYTIAMPKSMLIGGGWSMPVPENAEEAVQIGADHECLQQYIQSALGGTIDEAYAEADGAGRISIIDSEEDDEDAEEILALEEGDNLRGGLMLGAAGVAAAAAVAVGVGTRKRKK